MRHIVVITITLLFMISPLSVQYKETGFQFQREVTGESLCGDDENEDSDKEGSCVEDTDEDADEDTDEDTDDDVDEDADKDADENNKNVGETENMPPTSPTSCTNSATFVGTVGGIIQFGDKIFSEKC